MKVFKDVVYDPKKCKKELKEFGQLLKSRASLSERRDLQPFFKRRDQLSALIGTFGPNIGPAPQIAYEFPFFGDFAADMIVGNRNAREYLVIELEDGQPNSIFTKLLGKATKEWSKRFDHGFSQLVDWFYHLDDFKKTTKFRTDFGPGHIRFFGLLIIGRDASLADADRERLEWRSEKIKVDSHTIDCMTFDGLFKYLHMRIGFYPAAARLDK
jgi:hypothetical protein